MSHTSIPTKMIAKLQFAAPEYDVVDDVDPEEMISFVAYNRDDDHDLRSDDPLSDLLAAEAEIDSMLRNIKDTKARLGGR